MRQAVRQVVTALSALPHSARDIVSPLSPGHAGLVAGDGHSALVTFHVPGKAANEDQAVAPALRAVTRIQAAHPGLRIQEAGDASTDRAANALISRDFRKAEVTSVPITLILLIAVFGALIAAGIPLLLAATAVTDRDIAAGHTGPVAAGRLQHVGGGAAHRDGGRHRLLPVLPAPGA